MRRGICWRICGCARWSARWSLSRRIRKRGRYSRRIGKCWGRGRCICRGRCCCWRISEGGCRGWRWSRGRRVNRVFTTTLHESLRRCYRSQRWCFCWGRSICECRRVSRCVGEGWCMSRRICECRRISWRVSEGWCAGWCIRKRRRVSRCGCVRWSSGKRKGDDIRLPASGVIQRVPARVVHLREVLHPRAPVITG